MENTNSQAQSNHKEIIILAVLFLCLISVVFFLPLWILSRMMNFYLALLIVIGAIILLIRAFIRFMTFRGAGFLPKRFLEIEISGNYGKMYLLCLHDLQVLLYTIFQETSSINIYSN